MLRKKAATLFLLFIMVTVTACATYEQQQGAATGGVLGGIAGLMLNRHNPWQGGVIGAALGAIAGATIADISTRGARETVQTGRPVEYRTDNGRGMYHAEPLSEAYYPDQRTKCRKVHETVWEDNRKVKDSVREVCESERTEARY